MELPRRIAAALIAAPLILPSPTVLGQSAEPVGIEREPELIDRILAVVDEDPILASDVDQALGLGLVEREEGEEEEVLRRRVLDQLIDERLRFHEIDRFGFTEISLEEVEVGYEGIRRRFGSESALKERLENLGLDRDALRQLVARQILVLTYVEERLGPRVFVSLDDIREYYEETLKPELNGRGEEVPPIEAVREEIRAVLKELRLNEEIHRWTEELRLEADVEDYFERSRDDLPENVVYSTSAVEPSLP